MVNKGWIVSNADDSQAAEEPLSHCDTRSLILSPALPFSDLLHSPSTRPSSLNHWRCFLFLCSGLGRLNISVRCFFCPSVYLFFWLNFFFFFLQRPRKANTCRWRHICWVRHFADNSPSVCVGDVKHKGGYMSLEIQPDLKRSKVFFFLCNWESACCLGNRYYNKRWERVQKKEYATPH